MLRLPSALTTVAAAALTLSALPAGAETLRLMTNWDRSFYSSAFTIAWAESFNDSPAARDADIRIAFVGGPEVAPATEQMTALSNGVVDMLFGSAGWYVGEVPEAYALYGSPLTPMEARARGAIALMDEIYHAKANARVLGWVAAGVGYNLWLKTEPKLDARGFPDLTGLKIRSSGFYRAWLEGMGATPVNVPAPEIYTALERGVVDGAAWPGLGVTDYGWERFIGWRIDPPVWQFDNFLWVNADAWDRLTEAQRRALTEAVIAFEPVAHAHYAALAAEERAKVEAQGTRPFPLPPEAADRFVAESAALQWALVRERAPQTYDRLRAAFGAE